jgi:hypothetical protein
MAEGEAAGASAVEVVALAAAATEKKEEVVAAMAAAVVEAVVAPKKENAPPFVIAPMLSTIGRPAASYSLPPTPRELSGLPLRHREPPPRILDHRGLQIALSALPPHHLE